LCALDKAGQEDCDPEGRWRKTEETMKQRDEDKHKMEEDLKNKFNKIYMTFVCT